MTPRTAEVRRQTRETTIRLRLALDGGAPADVRTGIGFLDHLLALLAFHARWDLELVAEGDLEVDDHHTAEDCALALGQALDEALGDRRGVQRFGSAYAPLDEALARAVVDLSGRGGAVTELGLRREMIGALATENVAHVVRSLAVAARATVHVDVLRGENDHHRAEAAFKALALALREAVHRPSDGPVPSTKGTL
jgi:imidazoleglycerol phosphate dehydratase HisB